MGYEARWRGQVFRGAARTSLVLLLASAYMPGRVYVSNFDKFPHPERVAALVGVVWLVSFGFYLVMRRFTGQSWASLGSSAAFAILLGSGGNISALMTTLVACLLVLSIAVAFGALLTRFSADTQRFVVLIIAALAFSGPTAELLAADPMDDGRAALEEITTRLPETQAHHPDIYVIVLDAFPGNRALSDVYQHSIDWPSIPGVVRLDAWANYPVTLGSVTSLFQMGLPLADGTILDGGTRSELADIIAGDNRFVRTLAAEGYRTLVVESGWSRSYCHRSIDVCVTSHFVDEGVFEVLNQSVLGDLVAREFGSGFTAGAQTAMSWLRANLPELAMNDQPEFVFASVLLPHPPLMLDQNCVLQNDDWRSGNSVFDWHVSTELRMKAFLDQTDCVASFEGDLLDALPEDAVVVILSDHGGDSRGQLSGLDHSWSEVDILERMNVHLSLKMPYPCRVSEPSFVSEILRQVLYCLSDDTIPRSPDTAVFIADRIAEPKILRLEKLDQNTVRALGMVPSRVQRTTDLGDETSTQVSRIG